MKIHFSDIKSVIVHQLQAANSEILVAVSWLTDREIYQLLMNKIKAGVHVSVITRNDYLNNHSNALQWNDFIKQGGELRFCEPGKMLHYKFAVMDQKVAISTSYNWTCFAGTNNRENILVIDDAEAIQNFNNEFNFLSEQFPLQHQIERIAIENINPKLHGFYELTLIDDEKNQKV
jgi:phosphatidylserine/phosphatidylglycerophosphate/cardiolipin synthase-like enzyme